MKYLYTEKKKKRNSSANELPWPLRSFLEAAANTAMEVEPSLRCYKSMPNAFDSYLSRRRRREANRPSSFHLFIIQHYVS